MPKHEIGVENDQPRITCFYQKESIHTHGHTMDNTFAKAHIPLIYITAKTYISVTICNL